MSTTYQNPFRPGAGHPPPYLAGRDAEQREMRRILSQIVITENAIITGLRGVGKTALLETLKPISQDMQWLWAGTDLSESTSVSEDSMALRILVDIATATSSIFINKKTHRTIGYVADEVIEEYPISYEWFENIYKTTPGLVSDKIKNVLEQVWLLLKDSGIHGIVFAYDEAQNLADNAANSQYPLSLLLEVFQSIQRKGIPFLLILTGLPTLYPKLVEARTYAERMFHVLTLQQLDRSSSRDAILLPVRNHPIQFTQQTVEYIVDVSGGYPYFIQYICKELYDIWIAKVASNEVPSVPIDNIIRKLDADFFQGRWSQTTDRQKDLLKTIVCLESCDEEFTVQEVSKKSYEINEKGFSASHVSQMLVSLSTRGLVFKNRFGKYSLAVPLLSDFIRRQYSL